MTNNQKDKDNLSTCPVCGKKFIPAAMHIYKTSKNIKACSYTCAIKGGWKG